MGGFHLEGIMMRKRLFVAALGVATMAAGLVASPAAADDAEPGTRHSHAFEWRLKPAYQQWTTDNGATWVNSRPLNYDGGTIEYSNDGGSTYTATEAQYNAGEAGTDMGNGPGSGTFRYRQPHEFRNVALGEVEWSINGGTTWTGPGDAVPSSFDITTVEYSNDSGATWTATEAQYNTGEAGADSGDGPDAGTFRSRYAHQRRQTYVCVTEDGAEVLPEMVVTEDSGQAIPAPTGGCALYHSGPYPTNVADGTQPPGDWCVSGVSTLICRGQEYTFNEAKRRLGF